MGQALSSAAESNGGRESFLHLRSTAFVDLGQALGFGDGGIGIRDFTEDLPDECLARVFEFLGSGDRKQCSLVCKRWLRVDGQSRHRLSLDARAEIVDFIPQLFSRFDSVTKLGLRCDRKLLSVNDETLLMISLRCVNLTRLKLRGCREVTDLGISAFARNCKSLRKLSCGSCNFGANGLNALLEHCTLLEELSVKRLRGIGEGTEPIKPFNSSGSSSLKSICLKELVNGQSFESLVTGSKSLRSLKIIRCLGNWDRMLELIGNRNSSLTEIHLERLQVSDAGLCSVAKCPNLETLHILKTPECSNSGIVSIAEKCTNLRKLHIDGWRTNRIGDDGLMAIAEHCHNLQELVLIGVGATHLSLAPIASNCTKLERLALCGSGTIGDAEITCIAVKCTALRKLCVKNCSISDIGIEALALGCPNLVKLKVRKCRIVSSEVAAWLRKRRSSMVVSMDDDEAVDLGDEGGAQEASGAGEYNVQVVAAATAAGGGGRLAMLRTKLGFLAGSRNLVACTLRRWSNNEDNANGDNV